MDTGEKWLQTFGKMHRDSDLGPLLGAVGGDPPVGNEEEEMRPRRRQ